jgi:hypothetical protein
MQKTFFEKFFIEACPDKQARSIAWGACIAFSPFIGLHTLMTIAAAYLFQLNFALTLIVSCSINNPWTMLPIYAACYFFGMTLFSHSYFFEKLPKNPSWMNPIEVFFTKKLGISTPSLWPFLIGGTILSMLVGSIVYMLVRFIQNKIKLKSNEKIDPQDTYK